jgi:hypothetical protein
MELWQLRYFVAVAEEGQPYARAPRSQPSVRRQTDADDPERTSPNSLSRAEFRVVARLAAKLPIDRNFTSVPVIAAKIELLAVKP